MNENNKTDTSLQAEEQEIDLIELAHKVWAGKKLIIKSCAVALVVGIIVAFSIPKEYTTSVKLAPEAASKSIGGNAAALAALAGVNVGGSSGEDALSPELYPDIVSSTPFLVELFDVRVTNQKGNINTTLYNYLENDQKSAWWKVITSAPFKLLGWVISLFKEEGVINGNTQVNLFQLTSKENEIAQALSSKIGVSVDKKSGVTTLSVTMQDPTISAALTDTVMQNLQSYITEYRTNKARHDLAFTESLYKEAEQNYYAAQKKYANYFDGNRDVVLQSFRMEQERLLNEMNLAYGIYNQMAQQLQISKAKVQEITPIYTVIQPATVPLKPAKPNKIMIMIGCIFLAGVCSVGWLLFGKDLIKGLRKQQTQ